MRGGAPAGPHQSHPNRRHTSGALHHHRCDCQAVHLQTHTLVDGQQRNGHISVARLLAWLLMERARYSDREVSQPNTCCSAGQWTGVGGRNPVQYTSDHRSRDDAADRKWHSTRGGGGAREGSIARTMRLHCAGCSGQGAAQERHCRRSTAHCRQLLAGPADPGSHWRGWAVQHCVSAVRHLQHRDRAGHLWYAGTDPPGGAAAAALHCPVQMEVDCSTAQWLTRHSFLPQSCPRLGPLGIDHTID